MFSGGAAVVAVLVVEFNTSVFTPFSGIVDILELELGTNDVSTADTPDRLLLLPLLLPELLLLLPLILPDTLTLAVVTKVLLLLLLMTVDETGDVAVIGEMVDSVIGAVILDGANDDILGDDADEDGVIGVGRTTDEGVALRGKFAFAGAVLAVIDAVAIGGVVVIVGAAVLHSTAVTLLVTGNDA